MQNKDMTQAVNAALLARKKEPNVRYIEIHVFLRREASYSSKNIQQWVRVTKCKAS